MKPLPAFLLNVVVVLVAIVVYDRMRVEDAPQAPPPGPSAALVDAFDSMDARLTALEAASLSNPKGMGAPEPGIEKAPPATVLEPKDPPTADAEQAAPVPTSGEVPSPEDIAKFRKLAAAARQEELAKRNGRLVDEVLEKLEISLTGEQRTRLVSAYGAFGQRRNEIWREAKTSGSEQGGSANWDVIIAETIETIEREFTDRISGFISLTDAAAISEGLNSAGK